jgi:hypothetical protein
LTDRQPAFALRASAGKPAARFAFGEQTTAIVYNHRT